MSWVVRNPEPLKSSRVPPLTDQERRAMAAAAREIRARQGLAQEHVAASGELDPKTVGMVERAEVSPTLATVVALARGLGVPLSELVRVYEERLI